jgi:SAM-dependent methyltransferase
MNSPASAMVRTRQAWKRWRFVRRGMKPWSKGYSEYKASEIQRVLREGTFRNDALPPGYGFRLDERIVEYAWLFSRLPAGPGTLLDAGSVLNFEWLIGQPAMANKKVHICTLAPEQECHWNRGVSYLFDDLRKLPYREGWFDWVACLSTLEHVGMDNTIYTADPAFKQSRSQDYLTAVSELKRVLKPGGTLYLSVPYGRYVNHGWLQIFDQPLVQTIVDAFAPRASQAHYFLYWPEGWRCSSASEAADATFYNIHTAKGYDADFAASARAVCCLSLDR